MNLLDCFKYAGYYQDKKEIIPKVSHLIKKDFEQPLFRIFSSEFHLQVTVLFPELALVIPSGF